MELMIGLAIAGIVMTIVVPSGQNVLIKHRIIAEINEVSAITQFARNHAIDEQVDTIVCPSDDFATCGQDWNQPKIVFADIDGNGNRNLDEELLVATSSLSSSNVLTGPAVSMRFQGNGAVSSPATLLICHKGLDAQFARALTISLQGRVRMSQDSNYDGIHENNAGNALSCI